ncbi:unnamed protein product [Durusdinium trenchii]|uniref:Uncharacterized protein n=1 Tax=Durusdinium trenchii TaxID=1381693 RepID=A0ABP0HVR3_9DINO
MHLLKDVFEDDLICSSGWTAREAASTEKEAIRIREKKFDFVLFAYFALWYLGNYYYNITNKSGRALQAAGGTAGFPMTIATMQAKMGGTSPTGPGAISQVVWVSYVVPGVQIKQGAIG